ncbi:peptidase inhibitor family I36 protein [Streptomyces sp. NPDC003691]
MTLAAAVPAAASTSAAEPVKEITGNGLSACPESSLCLYQDRDFNEGGDARIWIVTGDVERLSKYDANDRTSSAYLNAPRGWTAKLYTDAEYEGESLTLTTQNIGPWTRLNERERLGDFSDAISSVRLFPAS